MNPVTILNFALALLTNAVPELLALYDTLKSGGTVADADVTAVLAKYGVDAAALQASIDAEKAAGG